MSTQSTIYLVTGASRGIGLGLVNAIVEKDPSAFIYAGVRTPSSATHLEALSSKYPGRIEIIKYVAADVVGNQAMAKHIEEKHGRVDVVIANAAIANYMGPASEVPIEQLREHFEVNTISVIVLFQAAFALLKRSISPKFIPITSGVASLTYFIDSPVPHVCYGSSKAALNYISRKIHFENEWLVCFPLAPGMVDTDMAREGISKDTTGFMAPFAEKLLASAEDACNMLFDIIKGSTRELHGGEFVNVDGSKVSW